jgi:hypothetical protein
VRKRSQKNAAAELPDGIRASVRGEIDRGLIRFRAGDFEVRLRDRLRTGEESSARAAIHSRPPRLWAPAAAVLLGAVVVAAAVLLLSRGPAPVSAGLDATLAGLPGFRTLESALPAPAPPAGTPGKPESAISRSLAAAAASSAAVEPASPEMERIVPRYNLKRKLEILIKEEPIERALELITTNKFQGGMTT